MRTSVAASVFAVFCSASIWCEGQTATPPDATTAPAFQKSPASQSSPASPAPTGPSASSLLKSPLDGLQQTLTGLRLDKWKSGSVRTEATANIASIQKDLQGTLPELIAAADAAPSLVSKALPVSRNLDALYAVLVRVVDGARVAAPGDQVDQLTRAMAEVQKSRLALNDQLQDLAAAAEKQVADLQLAVVQMRTPAPAACPAIPAAKPSPTPAAKKKVVKKKPATPPPATQAQPGTTAKPNAQ